MSELIAAYQAGSSVCHLARQFELHRTTVLDHLKRQGIPRRPWVRKLTASQVQRAAELYATGLSLTRVAEHFNVDAATIRRAFERAGIHVRPRRGWPPSGGAV